VELVVQSVAKHFGGVAALDDVSLRASQGAITALIGPNGAGKTTLFNAMTGFAKADKGTIHFGDVRLDRLTPWQVARHGVIRTFQTPVGFPSLTVLENMFAAGAPHAAASVASVLRFRAMRAEARTSADRAKQLLRELQLWDLRDRYVDELSTGDRKLLEFARQLMMHPRVLLLDEPAAGVAPSYVDRLAEVIRSLRTERGISCVVIDHNLAFIMQIADHIHVLDRGRLIASGTPKEIADNADVMRIYVGSSAVAS